jgi:hypothetical protein
MTRSVCQKEFIFIDKLVYNNIFLSELFSQVQDRLLGI